MDPPPAHNIGSAGGKGNKENLDSLLAQQDDGDDPERDPHQRKRATTSWPRARGTSIAATFHPELSDDVRMHALFLSLA
jgi:hypothetical protein